MLKYRQQEITVSGMAVGVMTTKRTNPQMSQIYADEAWLSICVKSASICGYIF